MFIVSISVEDGTFPVHAPSSDAVSPAYLSEKSCPPLSKKVNDPAIFYRTLEGYFHLLPNLLFNR